MKRTSSRTYGRLRQVVRLQPEEGTELPVDIMPSRLPPEPSRLAGAVVRDITERRRSAVQARRAEDYPWQDKTVIFPEVEELASRAAIGGNVTSTTRGTSTALFPQAGEIPVFV